MSFDNLDHRDVWIRTAKTFTVTFIAVFTAGLVDLYNSFATGGLTAGKTAAISLSVSAFAGALTAIWNYIIQGTAKGQ